MTSIGINRVKSEWEDHLSKLLFRWDSGVGIEPLITS